MIYHLFDYLESHFQTPGASLLQYISVRAALSVIVSLLISLVFGKSLIRYLHRKQVGETVRDLGLDGQKEKEGTPTMGGLIILASILIPTLLFANLTNVYIQLMLFTTVWLGILGFIDDYIKVFKKDKQGLSGKFKVIGQITLGIIIGVVMYFNEDVVMREKIRQGDDAYYEVSENQCRKEANDIFKEEAIKSTKTTLPFVKNNEFDYAWFIKWAGGNYRDYAWIVFIFITIFIIVAISNGANMTDGLDGLAASTSSVMAAALGILAWISGNFIFADYLNIMYIPNTGELAIFIFAFVGAMIGFLWYNTYPAQVFMGDTGSLAIGGIIAVFAIIIRKEFLIPILCLVFIIENFSVVLQVTYFKFTKKKNGVGKRIFLMAPLHHHYQKKGYHEAKIVQRFFIVGIICAVLAIITLKVR